MQTPHQSLTEVPGASRHKILQPDSVAIPRSWEITPTRKGLASTKYEK
jgi:hypothetical protein